MRPRPIAASPDLARLADEGYDIGIVAGHLVVRDVPYVSQGRTVGRAILLFQLDLAGDTAQRPSTHVAMWTGEFPCSADGTRLSRIEHSTADQDLGGGLFARFSFSSKPQAGYADYYEMVTSYINHLEGQAKRLDPAVSARTGATIAALADTGPFRYVDSATARAGLGALNERLAVGRIAIVGLGGTGSYVLDLLAKTPVDEIHLFDGDVLLTHNAFRCPGVVPLDDLEARPNKAEYWRNRYATLRTGIVAHPYRLDASNAPAELAGFDYVFVCIDGNNRAKKAIADALGTHGTAFVDTGMGLWTGDGVGGIVRSTTSMPADRDRLLDHLPKSGGDAEPADNADDPYSRNIQVADLNMLNAVLAVLAWKRHQGFYATYNPITETTFTIETGQVERRYQYRAGAAA